MEIVINPEVLFSEIEPELVSGSQAELGPDAGRITWRNALKLAEQHDLADALDYDALREHFQAYGAWDKDEIADWTETVLRAMAIQEIAADYRAVTEQGADQDQVRHSLAADGLMYCYFGV